MRNVLRSRVLHQAFDVLYIEHKSNLPLVPTFLSYRRNLLINRFCTLLSSSILSFDKRAFESVGDVAGLMMLTSDEREETRHSFANRIDG